MSVREGKYAVTGRGDWCRLSFNLEEGKRKRPRGGTEQKNTVVLTSKPFPRPVQFYTASLLGVESHPALAKFMLQKHFFWRTVKSLHWVVKCWTSGHTLQYGFRQMKTMMKSRYFACLVLSRRFVPFCCQPRRYCCTACMLYSDVVCFWNHWRNMNMMR